MCIFACHDEGMTLLYLRDTLVQNSIPIGTAWLVMLLILVSVFFAVCIVTHRSVAGRVFYALLAIACCAFVAWLSLTGSVDWINGRLQP